MDTVAEGSTGATFALIGPGRAGATVALALVARGYVATSVAGRAPDAPSTMATAACLDAKPVLVSKAGRGAAIVIVATPDAAIEATAVAVAPSLRRDALVVHLAGSLGLGVFAPLLELRPDVRVGALHPLQSMPSVSIGLDRLPGSWAAIAGDPQVGELSDALELRTFVVADDQRARYHAMAVVASNHLVALLGQVERLAVSAGIPFEAFAPLAEASLANAFGLGARAALTGPVQRGDLATVADHLRELPPSERDAYRALAREAARLAGNRDNALDRLLADLVPAEPPAARSSGEKGPPGGDE
ncbi:MAG: hypothetical protein QOH10_2549 [Actinomycetota bacterium]|nr:hypothetical protein [Actinomycetota bacterium]